MEMAVPSISWVSITNMDGQDFLKTLPQHFPITAREWKREMPFVN